MGVIDLAKARHARASTVSTGYKSGRNSCRGMPVTRSTAITRKGGTSSHCETAWGVMPSGVASPANPPTASMARFSALVLSFMVGNSSMALVGSQAPLHCPDKGLLYNIGMTLGERLKAARERLDLTQADVARRCRVSSQAVSNWERNIDRPDWDTVPILVDLLKITFYWLYKGIGKPPPDPQSVEVFLDSLPPAEQARLLRMVKAAAQSSDDVI